MDNYPENTVRKKRPNKKKRKRTPSQNRARHQKQAERLRMFRAQAENHHYSPRATSTEAEDEFSSSSDDEIPLHAASASNSIDHRVTEQYGAHANYRSNQAFQNRRTYDGTSHYISTVSHNMIPPTSPGVSSSGSQFTPYMSTAYPMPLNRYPGSEYSRDTSQYSNLTRWQNTPTFVGDYTSFAPTNRWEDYEALYDERYGEPLPTDTHFVQSSRNEHQPSSRR